HTTRVKLVDSPKRSLFVASAVGLFVELALIRWIPNTVHVVGFFANLVLIGAFLGLGIGLTKVGSMEKSARDSTLRLAIVIAALSLLGLLEPVATGVGGDYALNEGQGRSGVTLPLVFLLITTFGLVVWALIPFGRIVAARFDSLARLSAYSINVAGSLAGVVLFTIFSWSGTPPWAWFGFALALLLILGAGWRMTVFMALILVVPFTKPYWDSSARVGEEELWSPYYKIRVSNLDPSIGRSGGFSVEVNNQFLLTGLDLRPESLPSTGLSEGVRAGIESLKSYYDFPFLLRSSKRVLILGAGAGNDIAAALRGGAEEVVAVEIDPKVVSLARDHPENPLANDRVSVVVDDARAYLREGGSQFDLILFATLDAHGLLSSLGSVRLDSFIYTLESLAEAKSRLGDGGLLVLSFGPFREDIQLRQYDMVRQAFDREPLYFVHTSGHRTIVAGATDTIGDFSPGVGWRQVSGQEIAAGFASNPHSLIPATDDWPHLYNRERVVPREYLTVLGAISLLSLLLIRTQLRGLYRLQPHFLFLGAGFLLLETKSVIEFALLIGSTWVTNALVIGVILAAIWAVNIAVLRGWMRLAPPTLFGLLGVLLLFQFAVPLSAWASAPTALTLFVGALYLGVPIVLASSIFATTFQRVALGTAALASNLLGAVLGGLAEYASLVVGIRALSLVALSMYAFALLFWWRGKGADYGRADPVKEVVIERGTRVRLD
ncbi:MAG TPA: methyltransferase domain-containing protein, partial [Acidimicrobiia bacterium]|nr:methyltransferase domain-containing protein [Acidimicrobiia bacterium]